ncbi:MAG: hypothetical protein GWN01_14300, partial [Nitrosopumilaceae archaeon]|nr:hypothetical protein [Nitrosopumilaceae archaeon]NIU02028.1 hypothetical protein [Nitrosopumilaceae archaeon]NIU88414.1 hypothetical protein [Nitrosopumilaceae archaeon]NIV66688.1 hypothetical protein [Nitrosopumilaceae archaeon]NIX62629.1 hypothetical protein [Nitrosopumilaceae archaeon]
MEKTIYLILSREQDKFNIVYAGDCEKTEDSGYFIKNPNFKCWVGKSGSEKFLYLAILPRFESDTKERRRIIDKIISQYDPVCNSEEIPEDTYRIKSPTTEPEPEP